ncbi:hypothetical protein BDR05DRAFT_860062, partial [Suillus weaverae]
CRYSILPALSLNSILHLEVLDHSFSGEEFGHFISGLLDQMQPWPMPNLVLVMDNTSIHKVSGIHDMVEEWYTILFGHKAWLCSNHDHVLGETKGPACDLYTLIWEAIYGIVTSEKAYGWYKHSKYIA